MSERLYRVDYIEEETYLLFEAQGAKLGFPSFEAYLEHLVMQELARPDTPENRAAHARMRQILSQGGKDHSAN